MIAVSIVMGFRRSLVRGVVVQQIVHDPSPVPIVDMAMVSAANADTFSKRGHVAEQYDPRPAIDMLAYVIQRLVAPAALWVQVKILALPEICRLIHDPKQIGGMLNFGPTSVRGVVQHRIAFEVWALIVPADVTAHQRHTHAHAALIGDWQRTGLAAPT